MIGKNRKVYPYYLDGPSLGAKKQQKPRGRVLRWLLVMVLAGAAAYWATTLNLIPTDLVLSILPVPNKLVSVRLMHNGKEVVLQPGAELAANPKDTIQLLGAENDGWGPWQTELESAEIDLARIREKPAVIENLMPGESFESPQTIALAASWHGRPLGRVSLVVRLSSQDWLKRAMAVADVDRKIAYLENNLAEDGGNILIKTQLANLYYEAQRYPDALKLYQEIIKSGKSKPILKRLLDIYLAENRIDDAARVHLELLELAHDAESHKELLAFLKQHKSLGEVDRFIQENRSRIPKRYREPLLVQLAELHSGAEDWTRAAAIYDELAREGNADPNLLYNRAVAHQQGNDRDGAIRALKAYLEKAPKDLAGRLKLAQLQEEKGDFKAARATYRALLKQSPKHEEALIRLVALLEKAGDNQGLKKAYQQLAALQPNNKAVRFNLSMLYYKEQQWDKAMESFQALATADPKDIPSRKYLFDIYRRQNNRDKQIAILNELLELEPDNPDHYDALFSLYDDRRDYDSIVTLFTKATAKSPDAVKLHQYLLYGLLKKDDSKSAVAELEHLIRLEPKETKHLRQAANLYIALGDHAKALARLEKLLELDPKDKEAQEDYLRLKMVLMGPDGADDKKNPKPSGDTKNSSRSGKQSKPRKSN